ncbi:MAG: prolyl oligopeptidase family serine peptidase [Pirellulaceae bacterium]
MLDEVNGKVVHKAGQSIAQCVAVWFSFVSGICVVAQEQPSRQIVRCATPDAIEYGIWNSNRQLAAPTLFVLSGTIESSLEKPYFRQCGNELAKHGWICVSIDLPCHGTFATQDEPSGLSGWSYLAARERNFVEQSNDRLTSVLDDLIKTGATDPERVAVCGTSRGGFLALHFAAHDRRVRCAAGFAPVTDLAALSEFRAVATEPFVKSLSLENVAGELAGRPLWLVIGDQDERVGTDQAIAFARKVTAASRAHQLESRIELNVLPEPRGHTTPDGSATRAASWILNQFVDPTSVERPTEREFLFVDDHHILYRSGTERILHPANLHSENPLIREDKPWELAIGWVSVALHPETRKYQLWYQAYGGGRDERKTHKCVVCYAESDDGVTFVKPELSVHDFKTERKPFAGHHQQTNIVLLGEGGYGDRYANSVLLEPGEPDISRRYKMLYTDFSKDEQGAEWPGFHAAFSSDGIHWTKSSHNPLNQTAYGGRGSQPPFSDEDVYSERWDERKQFTRKTWRLPISMSDAVDVMFDPVRGVYSVYGKSWLQGPDGGLAWKHAMARVDSRNFVDWSKPKIVAWPDEHDPPDTEFHTSPVFYYKGVYFCLNQILHARAEAVNAKADQMHVELMTSRDGLRWDRPFRDQPFFPSERQAFSNGGVFTNSTPIFLRDEIRFYYGGYNSGAIGGGAALIDSAQQSGVGLATIRLDRFAGVRPVETSAQSTLKRPLQNIGQITLKPIDLTGIDQISLNADASGGSIRVEILTEDGYRVRGFTKDDAIAVTSDTLRGAVSWKARDLGDLPPGKYLLRFHLDKAEVFAMSLVASH